MRSLIFLLSFLAHKTKFKDTPPKQASSEKESNMLLSALLVLLLMFLPNSTQVVQAQFFLPDHPYVAPLIDPDTGIQYQRSPCPALNLLANHGYIAHNGTDIAIRDIIDAAYEALEMPQDLMERFFQEALRRGIPVTRSSDGAFSLNLIDLHTHNAFEHDASMTRQDHFFQPIASVDTSLVDGLVAQADDDDLLRLPGLMRHRTNRILDSRTRNPQVDFDTIGDLPSRMAVDTALILFFSPDDQYETVPTSFVRDFFLANRIPDAFVRRSDRGRPPFSLADPRVQTILDRATASAAADMTRPLPGADDDDNNKSHRARNWAVGLGIPLFLMVVPWVWKCLQDQLLHQQQHHHVHRQKQPPTTPIDDNHDDGHGRPEMPERSAYLTSIRRESPKSLSWENLSITLTTGHNNNNNDNNDKNNNNDGSPHVHKILSNLSGSAKAGHLSCIMGPSGSGKTSLLSTLAGRNRFSMSKATDIQLEGDILINDKVINKEETDWSYRHRLGYVKQDDALVALSTVREAIRFAARLRLPRNVTAPHITALVNEIIADLRLEKVRDSLIGQAAEGISGGEKRRVSLGIELITQPKILLLDEVTSGTKYIYIYIYI